MAAALLSSFNISVMLWDVTMAEVGELTKQDVLLSIDSGILLP